MKTQKTRTGILLLLLLFFGYSGFGQVVITPAITPACHSSDGAVTFTITGGSGGAYVYSLYHYPSGYLPEQSSPTFTNLNPGYYVIYALNGTDSTGQAFTIPTTVTLNTTVTNTTCPTNAGVISTVASGGTGGYTYQWSNAGSTTSSINNLPGGPYILTVTDGNGCSVVEYDTVYASSPISIGFNTTGPVCNPVITATTTGSTGALTYQWSTGETTAGITNLNNNQYYSVVVTDANHCSSINGISAHITTIAVDSLNSTIHIPTCLTNGSITVAMASGTAPYNYVWSNGGTGVTISGLSNGAYNVTVTDQNGCTGTEVFYLYNYNNLVAYISNATNPTCGGTDGVLQAGAIYGGGSYTYSWTGGVTGDTRSNLAAGTYTVTVTDGNGCSTTASHTLTGVGNFSSTVVTTPTACDTLVNSGAATVVVSGTGVAPYSFLWNISTWFTSRTDTSQTITGLENATRVTVVVTDASGCISNGVDTGLIVIDPACFDHITGYVYEDANGNCTFDVGEIGSGASYVLATSGSGQVYYATPDASGYYDMEVFPGIYSVNLNLQVNGGCVITTCGGAHIHSFTAIGQTFTGVNFGVAPGTPTYNLGVHMGYMGSAPGQQRQYWIYYYNWGVSPVANGTLTFTHDPNITLVSTVPPYTNYNSTTHTITWAISNNLDPMGWLDEQHKVYMQFDIPSTLALGTPLTAQAQIDPTSGDCNPADNSEFYTDIVSASHDPNEKTVSPSGNLSESDTVLNYTIRFQNTGNAPATTVVIKDTLSNNVDPKTVVPGASSAPYIFSLSGNGILTFRFQPIYLTDSATNVDSSMGFVNYSVHTKPNLPLGTQVKNTAFIYFDQNPAVVTNTTVSTRSDATGIKSIANDVMTARVVPNPVHDIANIEFTGNTGSIQVRITDELGNIVITDNSDGNRYMLNAEKLASGVYFYTAQDAAKNTAVGKISIVR